MGRAYWIEVELKSPDTPKTLNNMTALKFLMGEETFLAAWREAFEGEEPPIEELREMMRKMGGKG